MSTAQSAAVREDEQINEVSAPEGQIGYDLSRFDNSETVRSVRSQEAGAVPGSKRRPKPRFRLSLLTVLCCIAAIGLTGLMLRAYLNLTVINDEIAKLEESYATLCNDHVKLQKDYESRYDLGAVEKYAQETLGMIKMERSQVEYVEIASPDSIRAVESGSGSGYINSDFSQVWNAIREFFGG